jgi:hypothetical protein
VGFEPLISIFERAKTLYLRPRRNSRRQGARLIIVRYLKVQGAAEITPTFQRGITNKGYEVSPKTIYFPNVDIKPFFTLGFKNYIIQMVAVTADKHLEPFFLNCLL